MPIKEETEVEIKENPKDMASVVVAAVTAAAAATKEPHKPAYNVRTGELIKEPSTMPNTFPEWWGHKEFEPQAVSPPPRKETQKQETQDTQPESYGTSWISCKCSHTNNCLCSMMLNMFNRGLNTRHYFHYYYSRERPPSL